MHDVLSTTQAADGARAPETALITGASRGLGRTLAAFLAAQGYRLVLTARERERLDDVATELRAQTEVVAIHGDVRDASHRADVAREVGPHLDLLVNNASSLGPTPMPLLADLPLDGLRDAFETNVVAPLALVQAMTPALRAAGGLVVNITSDAACGGYAGWGAYGATKAALELLTRTLSTELDGVSAVIVDPGDMRTDMHQAAFPGEDISDRPLPRATLPFWAWLLGRDRAAIDGRRFQAQDELWRAADEAKGVVVP